MECEYKSLKPEVRMKCTEGPCIMSQYGQSKRKCYNQQPTEEGTRELNRIGGTKGFKAKTSQTI